jgi:hypothetical protein
MNVNTEERLTAKQALQHDWILQRAVPEALDEKAATEAFSNLQMFRVISDLLTQIDPAEASAGGFDLHRASADN